MAHYTACVCQVLFVCVGSHLCIAAVSQPYKSWSAPEQCSLSAAWEGQATKHNRIKSALVLMESFIVTLWSLYCSHWDLCRLPKRKTSGKHNYCAPNTEQLWLVVKAVLREQSDLGVWFAQTGWTRLRVEDCFQHKNERFVWLFPRNMFLLKPVLIFGSQISGGPHREQ